MLFLVHRNLDGGQEGGNELSLAGFLVDSLLRNVYILIRTDVLIELVH